MCNFSHYKSTPYHPLPTRAKSPYPRGMVGRIFEHLRIAYFPFECLFIVVYFRYKAFIKTHIYASHNSVNPPQFVVCEPHFLTYSAVSRLKVLLARTKMAVDLSVARRQLGEALGDFSQTYDHSFLFVCNEALFECSSTFFLLILKVLEQHEAVVQTKGTVDCKHA